jgi:NRAMP (natural resistance-associated macrophage protein)-like metal ion transporter
VRQDRGREPDDDDDLGRPGEPVQDPLLRVVPGRHAEPDASALSKRFTGGDLAATGTTAAGGKRRGVLGWLQLLGPGLITGASDDDPSGIGTYSQVGSRFGYSLLWTSLFTFPLMAAVQELCARVALHTGVGMATALRRRFPTWLVGVCIVALFAANTINAGADLGAIAAGGSLLTRSAIPPLWLVAPVGLLILGLQLFLSYGAIFKIFKWLTLALFAYVATGVLVHPDVRQVVYSTLVPQLRFERDYIGALVALLGTTISPYLFFWQAASEVDEMRAAGKRTEAERRGVNRSELRRARTDIVVGMLFSNLVMFFIMVTAAAVLHAHGKTDVQSAEQAAQALAPLAGQWSFVLFALGMIGTGLLAMPILTGSAAYAVRDFLGLKGALSDKPAYRPTFYAIMVVSTVIGVALNLVGVDTMRALYLTAIINGMVAPPILILIVLLGSDRDVMANRTSGRLSKALTWATVALMCAAAVGLVITLVAS